MFERTDVIYRYDGSFDGLLCCIFESFRRRERPAEVEAETEWAPGFFASRTVQTDPGHAERVARGLRGRASEEAFWLLQDGFRTCAPQRDRLLVDFAHLAMEHGPRVMAMMGDETVSALLKAVRHLQKEAGHYLGFVRFSESEGMLTAVIEPRNAVLPLMAEHFADRFPREVFLIYDKTHREALIHRPGAWDIIPLEEYRQPQAAAEEQESRALWKLFYDTLEIRERHNPRCRMNHMPKRFWAQLTEMQEPKKERPLLP